MISTKWIGPSECVLYIPQIKILLVLKSQINVSCTKCFKKFTMLNIFPKKSSVFPWKTYSFIDFRFFFHLYNNDLTIVLCWLNEYFFSLVTMIACVRNLESDEWELSQKRFKNPYLTWPKKKETLLLSNFASSPLNH